MQIINMQLENGNQTILNIFKIVAKEMGAKLKINKQQLTENGFTKEFEEELLRELKETKRLATENKIPVYDTDEKFYKHLANEYGYKAKKWNTHL